MYCAIGENSRCAACAPAPMPVFTASRDGGEVVANARAPARDAALGWDLTAFQAKLVELLEAVLDGSAATAASPQS